MSKYISSNELWDHIYNYFSFPNSPRGKKSMKFTEKYGNLSINHFSTGLGIRYSSFCGQFNHDTIVESPVCHDSSFFCFNTGKEMYMEDSLKKEQVKWDADICWNGRMYQGHRSNSLYSKDKPFLTHCITFDNNLYKEIVDSNPEFKKAKSIYKGDYIDVNLNNRVTSQQKKLLTELLQASSLDNKLQELYLESKLLDLVYSTVNSVDIRQKHHTTFHLNKKDIESLYKAKKLLIENMENPPSLKELAYKSAINEFKLKKGFKQLFGNTVYGLLQEYRLNEAKKLLETNEINIGEASSIVGYKSISHFSKIFKDHFGIAPIEIKKESRNFYF